MVIASDGLRDVIDDDTRCTLVRQSCCTGLCCDALVAHGVTRFEPNPQIPSRDIEDEYQEVSEPTAERWLQRPLRFFIIFTVPDNGIPLHGVGLSAPIHVGFKSRVREFVPFTVSCSRT